MESKKRKREDDPPRITFVTPSRTFERLFKETSLGALTTAVSKKLGVDAGTAVELIQLRGGRSIDLEDDDDFDALRSYALSSGSAEISVTFQGASKAVEIPQQSEVHEQVVIPFGGPTTTKEKKQKVVIHPSTNGIDSNTPGASSSTPALPSTKKEKPKSKKHGTLVFTVENGIMPATSTESIEKPKSKRKVNEKSVLVNPIPSTSATQVEEPRSDEAPKKRRKKTKKIVPEGTTSELASTKPTQIASNALPIVTEGLTSNNTQQAESSAGLATSTEAPEQSTLKTIKPLKERMKKKQKNGVNEAETISGPDPLNPLTWSDINSVQTQPISMLAITAAPETALPQSSTPTPLMEPLTNPPRKTKKPPKQPQGLTDKVVEVPTMSQTTPLAVPDSEPLPTVAKKKRKTAKVSEQVSESIPTEVQSVAKGKKRSKTSEPDSRIESGTPSQVEAGKSKKRKVHKDTIELPPHPSPNTLPVESSTERDILALPAIATSSTPNVDTQVKPKKPITKKAKASKPSASSPSEGIDAALDDIIGRLRKGHESERGMPAPGTELVDVVAASALSTAEKQTKIAPKVSPETVEDTTTKKAKAKRRKAVDTEEVQRTSGILESSLSKAMPDSSPTDDGNSQKLPSMTAPRTENLRGSGVSTPLQGEASLENTKKKKINFIEESIGPSKTEPTRNSKEDRYSLDEKSGNPSKISQDERGTPLVISQDKQEKAAQSSERNELPTGVERDPSPINGLDPLSVNDGALELPTGDAADKPTPNHDSADLEEKSASTTEVERSLSGDPADIDVGTNKDSDIESSVGVQEKAGSSLIRDRSQSQPVSDSEPDEEEDISKPRKQLPVNTPRPRPSNVFRSLTDIATRKALFSPAATPNQFPLTPVRSFNQQGHPADGMTGGESSDDDDSSSSSDSDSDRQSVIPKERRAGKKVARHNKGFAAINAFLRSGTI